MKLKMLALSLLMCCVCRAQTTQPTAGWAWSMEQLKSGQTYKAPLNSTIVPNRTFRVTAAKSIINLNGSRLILMHGVSTDIDWRATNATITNGTLLNGHTAIRVWGSDNTLSYLNFDSMAYGNIFTDLGGNRLTISNCHFGKTGKVGLYITADDVKILNCSFLGLSTTEYNLRFELDSTQRHPSGGLVQNCEFNALTNGKCAVGVREGGTKEDPLVFDKCIFHGYLRTGQGTSDAPGSDAVCIFKNCIWPDAIAPASPGQNPLPDCDVEAGSICEFDNCWFMSGPKQVGVAVGNVTNVIINNPVQVRPSKGAPVRSMVGGVLANLKMTPAIITPIDPAADGIIAQWKRSFSK